MTAMVRGLLDLRKPDIRYVEHGWPREWRLLDERAAGHEADAETKPVKGWGGWERLGLPQELRFGITDPSIAGDGMVWLRDSYSADDETATTPGYDLMDLFRTLQSGGSVLVLSPTDRIPGFIPAALTILADPYIHIAKVINPILQVADLTQVQVGYLAGFADARRLFSDEKKFPAVSGGMADLS